MGDPAGWANGAGGEQIPVRHASPVVHALLSLQAVPFGVTVDPPTQTPFEHLSFVLQMRPSSHAVPFGALGFEHAPVAGLQTPATWH